MTDFIYDDYRYSGSTSTAIDQAFYDADLLKLYLEFHNGGKAAYDGVSQGTWEGYVNADSVGSYYNRNIVGRFPGTSADFDRFVTRARAGEQRVETSPEHLYKATIVVRATSYDSLVAAVVDMGVSEDDIVKVERA